MIASFKEKKKKKKTSADVLHYKDGNYGCDSGNAFTVRRLFCSQVRENAKQDLKAGLVLYNSEDNIGLRNAWNIIQAEVSRSQSKHCGLF